MDVKGGTPQALRARAERAFQLAEFATDASARDALTLYGQDLMAEADSIEAAWDDHSDLDPHPK